MLTLTHRKLKDEEIVQISKSITEFPDLVYVKPALFMSFTDVIVAEVDGKFAGFCAVQEYKGLRKLGPIAVAKKYHGAGVGRHLMAKIIEENKGRHAYLGSSNPKVKEYVKKLAVKEYSSIFQVPAKTRRAFFHFLLEYLSFKLLFEALRKRITYGRGKYTFFELQ